ncbi:biosynthetic arginine decarboxylase [Desulfohalovibrio reitneri]|uniref:biosynthetic arginine decarboxylase n=1 Tax=Desulfohalovibrio reitneri TaxID=1307759 RepID=UPI0004A6E598
MPKPDALERWNAEQSAELYNVLNWGAGYFGVAPDGSAVVTPFADKSVRVALTDIIEGLKERGLELPVLLRVEDILHSQITLLHESFRTAMDLLGYRGAYRGVYPIKVNQQEGVLEEITRFGARYHHGLEAGSKAELLAALAMLQDPDAPLICNGYKDQEFIDLGLYARKMGFRIFFVLEMESELDLILERSRAMGVEPLLGARMKLTAKAGGHWTESGGDLSIFGLNAQQIVGVVDRLRDEDMLHCLTLLHYHLGSQIPNIRDIRTAVLEACRVYKGLIEEGAPMGWLDLGGGLAVDYDGSHTNYDGSRNYTLDEYCADVVEAVMEGLAEADGSEGVEHPTIITESGRALVAYYSVLLFEVLDVSSIKPMPTPEELPEDTPPLVENLLETAESVNPRTIQECFNDAIYYRDEVRTLFRHGHITLRQRALAETIFWNTIQSIASLMNTMSRPPVALESLEAALADTYYCNFSVFQSLPDAWAIDQVFPIMPLQRLDERPDRRGVIADITCDCDGRIDQFIDPRGPRKTLALHEVRPGENYYLGAFLVGAYQETLGDLHNLLGDTNVVTVRIRPDGGFEFVREVEGDTVAEVLEYVEYDAKRLSESFRRRAERAVREGRIAPAERREILTAFEDGLRGYTYFER